MPWIGDYYTYNDIKEKLITKKGLDKKIKEGSVVLDIRSQEEYNNNHIKNAINVPVVEWGFEKNKEFFEKNFYSSNSIIIPCYNNINCFRAKISSDEIEENYNDKTVKIYPVI